MPRFTPLYFGLMLNFICYANGIQVKKCCDLNQLLDAQTFKCVPKNLVPPERLTHFLPSYMLNNGSDLMSSHLDINQDIQTGKMVNCPDEKIRELIDLTKPLEYLINSHGKLISVAGKFRPDYDLGEYCIDTAFLRSLFTFRAAVICNPCHSEKCVQSCCSHLQMAKMNPESGQLVCENTPKGFRFTSPALPKKLQNLTLIKSDNNRYENCEAKNGTMIVSEKFDIVEGGTSVSSGERKNCFFFNAF